MSNKKNAFTLIEMLVVITIIIVLTAIGVVSYSAAGVKARDGRRMADLEKIRLALEMYRQTNQVYPTTGTVKDDLSPTYLQSWPDDPKNFGYVYFDPTNYTYSLLAHMEDPKLANLTTGPSCGADVCNYQVKNP
ncbi:MAG: prepilin-type N-terminal cleavage/methylation domain-containing protein [Candidatus Shapirobacteria bacterium]